MKKPVNLEAGVTSLFRSHPVIKSLKEGFEEEEIEMSPKLFALQSGQ